MDSTSADAHRQYLSEHGGADSFPFWRIFTVKLPAAALSLGGALLSGLLITMVVVQAEKWHATAELLPEDEKPSVVRADGNLPSDGAMRLGSAVIAKQLHGSELLHTFTKMAVYLQVVALWITPCWAMYVFKPLVVFAFVVLTHALPSWWQFGWQQIVANPVLLVTSKPAVWWRVFVLSRTCIMVGSMVFCSTMERFPGKHQRVYSWLFSNLLDYMKPHVSRETYYWVLNNFNLNEFCDADWQSCLAIGSPLYNIVEFLRPIVNKRWIALQMAPHVKISFFVIVLCTAMWCLGAAVSLAMEVVSRRISMCCSLWRSVGRHKDEEMDLNSTEDKESHDLMQLARAIDQYDSNDGPRPEDVAYWRPWSLNPLSLGIYPKVTLHVVDIFQDMWTFLRLLATDNFWFAFVLLTLLVATLSHDAWHGHHRTLPAEVRRTCRHGVPTARLLAMLDRERGFESFVSVTITVYSIPFVARDPMSVGIQWVSVATSVLGMGSRLDELLSAQAAIAKPRSEYEYDPLQI